MEPEWVVPLIVGAAVSVVTTLSVQAIVGWWSGPRRRARFADALAAVVAYEEFPYVIRRRRASAPEDERIRIAEKIAEVQERLAFNTAWLRSESDRVADAYDALVAEVRSTAGGEMRRAWQMDPMEADAEANISDIDLSSIDPLKRAYLDAVKRHLSWRRLIGG
ncbi:MAG: hypothetical protein F4Z77_13050 [Dehalococcoidia bacterium]|nr:hypothetical protein [Dehalococcoidia bacterium]MYA52667.1 hypothetical protein [Dehalococcoidia bacterium]